MVDSLRVLVIGGGIGGLCLANGLRRAGVCVAVYERDADPDGWQGYRIHINRAGSRALHACLPPALWETFVATAGEPTTRFAFLNERMGELLVVAQPPAPDPARGEHPVSRVLLRRTLLAGVEGAVHFGKEFTHYERAPGGTITAHFADGTAATGDVLVGADGVGSRVRRQFLPRATVADTGITALSGRVPLTGATRGDILAAFATRLTLVMPPRGCAMFIAPFIRKPDHPAGGRTDDLTDHVFWALIARRDAFGSDLRHMDGAELGRIAARLVARWHPDLRQLVAASDPHARSAIRLQTATPVPPWETTNVTLLGDAIHTMTPLQGLGGNTALRDAHLLARALADGAAGRVDLLSAIRDYEAAMRGYGFAAVRDSLRISRLAASDSRIGRSLFMAALRVANAVPPLKARMFPAVAD